MQLTCSDCGEKITPENINIQQMVAVCSDCGTVFQFDITDASKVKRRKAKAPQHLLVNETDADLHLAFRTNFRLDQNEAFLTSIIMGVVFTFVTMLLISKFLAGGVMVLMPLVFGLAAVALYYNMTVIAFNKTHIEMDVDEIRVSRRPIPSLLEQPNTVNLDGIVAFNYEETATSKKNGYDTPRYRVWAETIDGRRKLIVTDLIEDYALYLTQKLNVQLENERDVSRLVDEVNIEQPAQEEQIDNHTRTSATSHSE